MKTIFSKDPANKKMHVTREFAAPVERTWNAWTDHKILDQWWAPKPWKAVTKSQDFREGGSWLYAMKGPEGETHWARADYKKIVNQEYYRALDAFCDENGNPTNTAPSMDWTVAFHATGSGTRVEIEISFKSEEDMKTISEMGFQEGFTMAHDNLDELLSAQS